MTDPGEVALVLHTHLPYLRGHGVWPVGEEWLFQAWGESWLPVTDVLVRLADAGHRDVLTLSVSPPVAHQLADPRLRRDVGTWLAGQMWQAEEQRGRYDGRDRARVRDLARWHWRRYARLLDLHERVEGDGGLLAVWSRLAAAGVVELLGGPATHPYLPLVADGALLDAQLATGLDAHAGWAGRAARGVWLPECGYRPAGTVADPTAEPLELPGGRPGAAALPRGTAELPGLERFLARRGVTHVVVDAPTVVRAAGGADRDWTRRPAVAEPGDPDDVVHDGVWVGEADVAAFARDLSVAYHVWSPTAGYPGDPWYRDFHARGGFGVHPSWRVTGKDVPPEGKAVYEPERAAERVAAHVDHLHGVLGEVLRPRPGGLVVAAYDTELFGHWWLEGPDWLERLLRRVHDDPRLRTTTLAGRLERRPPSRRLDLPESSWGLGKGHGSWVSDATRWMWAELRRAEGRFAVQVAAAPCGAGARAAVAQAARELAQAQASDWPFLVNRGWAPDYAVERFRGHVARLDRLLDAAGSGGDDDRLGTLAAELAATVDAPADPGPFLRAH